MKNRQMQALLTAPDGLGTALRAARGHRSMQQLADAITEIAPAGSGKWSSSKVSKLETGLQLPSGDEIQLWAKASNADANTLAHWQRLREDAESRRSLYRRRGSATPDPTGGAALPIEASSALIRVSQSAMIPELLQVEDYARAVWEASFAKEEVDGFIDDLRARQQILHVPEKRFQFLISEGALRTIRGSAAVMGTQLDRLISAASLTNATIGILPQGVPLRGPVLPAAFTLYDQDDARIEDGVGEYHYGKLTAATLREHLDAAWEDAVQGRAARKLILDAIDALNLD